MIRPNLTESESDEVARSIRWGSDACPVRKVGRGWHLEGFPTVYKTKRDAVAQWERRIELLGDKIAGRMPPSPGGAVNCQRCGTATIYKSGICRYCQTPEEQSRKASERGA